MDVSVLSVLDIVEVDNLISVQAELRMTWTDGRLAMKDLHPQENSNTLTSAFKDRIWLPEVGGFWTILFSKLKL